MLYFAWFLAGLTSGFHLTDQFYVAKTRICCFFFSRNPYPLETKSAKPKENEVTQTGGFSLSVRTVIRKANVTGTLNHGSEDREKNST